MTANDAARAKLAGLRALAMDVDGVLTDGGLWWGPSGEEFKRFCFSDIMGVSLARRAGLTLALISGENSPLVDRYAEKMLIRYVVKGCRDKATALRTFAADAGIPLTDVCFMGDDVNDLAALSIAGFSAAPSHASPVVLEAVQFVTKASGGNGAVRELVDAILAAQDLNVQEVFSRP
ncbi:MAG TPA: HAD hydrolase family protein [Acidobacteriaceae bacterium]|jgi:3-deoxy-D-manno-octulosonate 8-phosphate phosphatase (KDO 8-P phosphatase)|nr:HAD hydrolase family protein [Acidobacteriaceae bacterium]